jgi:RNA polymerase sigma-B factor
MIRARAELSQRLQRAPNATEIADHLGNDRELIIEATIGGNNYSTTSTDAPLRPSADHRGVTDSVGEVDPNLDKVLSVETVRSLIAALPERQRTVLTLRFFDNLTQTQIAERVGCSQMHVSRLLSKALDTLRSRVREPELAAG